MDDSQDQNAAVEYTKHKHKVLILGAGLSGITAGRTLIDQGIHDFLILEGQDYIGGRIKQCSFAGFNVEEGANWIQFAKDDSSQPIWKLVQEKEVSGVWTNYTYADLVIRNESGANITAMADPAIWDKVKKNFKSFQEERERDNRPDISVRIGLALLGWNPKTAAQKALEFLFTDYEYGKRPEQSAFREFYIPEDEFFITDQRGVMFLYQDIYKSFENKIHLNKRVSDIKYNANAVEVTTSDGEIYTADYGLCTFSTGVLGSDMVQFSPPLPDWKRESILKMPMSVYTKIFLKFPYRFWDDKEYILLSCRRRGSFPVLQNLETPGKFPAGSGMLLITVTEDEGRRIEKQSFDETKQELVKMLRGVYGKDIPEPTDIFYPRWSTNPFTQGAYSVAVVGLTPEDAENISRNLDNLYFAGEATSEDWCGYMQGAYLTGEEKAKVISNLIKSKDS